MKERARRAPSSRAGTPRAALRLLRGAAAVGIVATASAAPALPAAAAPSARLRFEISFAASVRPEPADGRVFVIVSRDGATEPRLQFGKSGGQYRSVPFFGEDVEGLAPGKSAVVDGRSDGYPLERLADLPPGDYWVQGLLNVYTTFPRADGRVVKMHMDQWEGQDLARSPGNLYSEPRKLHLDPGAAQTVRLSLDRKIPPIPVPADTDYVKHVRFESPLLSKFWGRRILIGATILLPKGYAENAGRLLPGPLRAGPFLDGRARRFRGGRRPEARRDRSGEGARAAPPRSSRRPGSRTGFRGCSS